jgi:acetyl-CoA carboxylase biotin carboxylase subunit
MFRRVLIANRGEIAQRVIRTCREMGIETVAVYSEADADALYLRQADETICIGPAPSSKSYLNIPSIISAAEVADVDAIHPGYGFLSENEHFAEVCNSCNITFIGPDPEAIAAVGNKARAREMAVEADVPVVPGSKGKVDDEKIALEVAQELGYPVMIKAASGGGGRGMRIARNDNSLVSGFHAARAEAEAAFGDGTVYLERFVENPRHVEIQLLGDTYGNVVHLFERDCSIQRRHQKLIEESPSPILTPDLRRRMGEAAVRLAKHAKYSNAGHVRVPGRPPGQLLLHRGQRPHPGRAHRDRARHGHRLDPPTDPGRGRRALVLPPGGRRAARPRHRVPHQCGRSRP